MRSTIRLPARLRLDATLPALVGILLLAAACQGARHPDIRIGETIPEFELPALGGTTVSSSSYAGRPVVLNFWATWCRPCIKEIPTFKAIAEDSAVQVVTIAIDDKGAGIVQPFVDRHGISYPVLLGDKMIFERFGGRAIPYTLVLDAGLRIVSLHRGYVSLRSLERDLRRAES